MLDAFPLRTVKLHLVNQMTEILRETKKETRTSYPASVKSALLYPTLLFCIFFYIVSSSSAIQVAHADPSSNPCTSSWSGPNRHNSFDCNNWLPWLIATAIPIVIPFAVSLLFFFPGYCVVLCGRYCCQCFGSSRMRPGHCCCGGGELDELPESEKMMMYSKCSILTTKAATLALTILGLVIVILCFVGGGKVGSTASNAAEAVSEGVDFLIDLVNQTIDGVKDPSDGSFPAGFDMSDFDDVINQMRKTNREIHDQVNTYDGYIKTYTVIPAYVAILPALVMSLPLLLAVCNIRSVAPLSIICCSFGLQFIVMFVATIFAVILLPINIVCGEINDQLDSKPGLFQWYVVPNCEYETPFQDIHDNVDQMEQDAAESACEAFLQFCSSSANWNGANPEILFTCNVSVETDCQTLSAVQGTMDVMIIKSGAPETCGGNPSLCTVAFCAEHCDSSDARTTATDGVKYLNIAVRVLNTFDTIIGPWLNCNRLINKVLESGPKQLCAGIGGGLKMICAGCYMSAFGLMICVVVCLLGQKRFVNQSAAEKSVASSPSTRDTEMSSYLVNAPGVPLHYNDAPSVSESPGQMKRESDFSGGSDVGYTGGGYAPHGGGGSYSPNESGFTGVVCGDPSSHRGSFEDAVPLQKAPDSSTDTFL